MSFTIRPYTPSDYPALGAAMRASYADIGGDCADEAELKLLHALYPDGQIVVYQDETLIGAMLNRVLPWDVFHAPHSMAQSIDTTRYRADAEAGDCLYTLDIFVPAAYRNLGGARRCVQAAAALVRRDNARCMLGTSRIPGFRQHANGMDIEAYVAHVRAKELSDPVLNFQLAVGCGVLGVTRDYNPSDLDSGGAGVRVTLPNPSYDAARPFGSRAA